MKVFKIVEELNGDLFDSMGEKFQNANAFSWIYSTDGYSEAVSFNEMVLWCSENEEREWIESENDYGPLKTFLLSKLEDYINNVYLYLKEQK